MNINEIAAEISELTEVNDHTGALAFLCNSFDCLEEFREDVAYILCAHESKGYLPESLNSWRYDISKGIKRNLNSNLSESDFNAICNSL